MKERPILFSAPMIRAILAGTKTQTRRKLRDDTWLDSELGAIRMCDVGRGVTGFQQVACPYGFPGDRLWVRESLGYCSEYGHYFAADRTFLCSLFDDEEKQTGYSYECAMRETSVPSIHLPRRFSRITLEITGVRVERLQDISEADAMAEGAEPVLVPPDGGSSPHAEGFRDLWKSINGLESWDANPWVWVVGFTRLEA